MFDTVHTAERCGQVKCFERMQLDLHLGDRVRLHRAETGEIVGCADFQIVMREGGFVVVLDEVIVGWFDDYMGELPCFDTRGRLIDLSSAVVLGDRYFLGPEFDGWLCGYCNPAIEQ